MRDIKAMDNGIGIKGFSFLLHEVMEGYYLATGAYLNDKSFNPSDPYQSSHWNAFLDQAKDLNVAFIASGKRIDLSGGDYYTTYSVYQQNKDGSYEKTTYKLLIEKTNGKERVHVNDNGSIDESVVSHQTIDAATFKKEKAAAQARVQAHSSN